MFMLRRIPGPPPLDPIGRRLDDRNDVCDGEVLLDRADLDVDGLVGQATVHEHHSSVVRARQRRAADHHVGRAQTGPFCRVHTGDGTETVLL